MSNSAKNEKVQQIGEYQYYTRQIKWQSQLSKLYQMTDSQYLMLKIALDQPISEEYKSYIMQIQIMTEHFENKDILKAHKSFLSQKFVFMVMQNYECNLQEALLSPAFQSLENISGLLRTIANSYLRTFGDKDSKRAHNCLNQDNIVLLSPLTETNNIQIAFKETWNTPHLMAYYIQQTQAYNESLKSNQNTDNNQLKLPIFLAPELNAYQEIYSWRSDIYSLGKFMQAISESIPCLRQNYQFMQLINATCLEQQEQRITWKVFCDQLQQIQENERNTYNPSIKINTPLTDFSQVQESTINLFGYPNQGYQPTNDKTVNYVGSNSSQNPQQGVLSEIMQQHPLHSELQINTTNNNFANQQQSFQYNSYSNNNMNSTVIQNQPNFQTQGQNFQIQQGQNFQTQQQNFQTQQQNFQTQQQNFQIQQQQNFQTQQQQNFQTQQQQNYQTQQGQNYQTQGQNYQMQQGQNFQYPPQIESTQRAFMSQQEQTFQQYPQQMAQQPIQYQSQQSYPQQYYTQGDQYQQKPQQTQYNQPPYQKVIQPQQQQQQQNYQQQQQIQLQQQQILQQKIDDNSSKTLIDQQRSQNEMIIISERMKEIEEAVGDSYKKLNKSMITAEKAIQYRNLALAFKELFYEFTKDNLFREYNLDHLKTIEFLVLILQYAQFTLETSMKILYEHSEELKAFQIYQRIETDLNDLKTKKQKFIPNLKEDYPQGILTKDLTLSQLFNSKLDPKSVQTKLKDAIKLMLSEFSSLRVILKYKENPHINGICFRLDYLKDLDAYIWNEKKDCTFNFNQYYNKIEQSITNFS